MIDKRHKLPVNGSEQWVFARGRADRPILLFVHGGPGFSLVPIARGFEKPFLDEYLVVHWEQRGAGKSFHSTDFTRGFSLDQFVADGLSVAEQIRENCPGQAIVLIGHSWGTVVGARMAAADPALFAGYISVGTNSHSMDAEVFRFESLEEFLVEKGELDDLAELKKIGRPPWIGRRFVEWGEFVSRYLPHERVWGKISMDQVTQSIDKCLEAGDYTEQELETAFAESIHQSFDRLAEDYYSFSAIDQVPKLDVPVRFLHGGLDFNTPAPIAKRYFEALEAPRGKEWIELKDCAHLAFYEDPKAFLGVCESILGNSG